MYHGTQHCTICELASALGHFQPVESLSRDRQLPSWYPPVISDETRHCLPDQVAIITLTSTVLVLFMTLPGLALFYCGLARNFVD